MDNHSTTLKSPLGLLEAHTINGKLKLLSFVNDDTCETLSTDSSDEKLVSQLIDYFNKKRTHFDLELELETVGTSFQKEVWKQLMKLPFGVTTTYGEIAEKLGDPNKMRAVGNAVGANPIPIIIPCHRVVGADNTLTGYSGGLWRKKWLLKHEGVVLI